MTLKDVGKVQERINKEQTHLRNDSEYRYLVVAGLWAIVEQLAIMNRDRAT